MARAPTSPTSSSNRKLCKLEIEIIDISLTSYPSTKNKVRAEFTSVSANGQTTDPWKTKPTTYRANDVRPTWSVNKVIALSGSFLRIHVVETPILQLAHIGAKLTLPLDVIFLELLRNSHNREVVLVVTGEGESRHNIQLEIRLQNDSFPEMLKLIVSSETLVEKLGIARRGVNALLLKPGRISELHTEAEALVGLLDRAIINFGRWKVCPRILLNMSKLLADYTPEFERVPDVDNNETKIMVKRVLALMTGLLGPALASEQEDIQDQFETITTSSTIQQLTIRAPLIRGELGDVLDAAVEAEAQTYKRLVQWSSAMRDSVAGAPGK
ncbi:hypothetical protein BDN72DRAFT_849875 [Pluteus cervinus]|uniref:Uncharacterized protein n=1 Tax=Pluteus cervinus TaxID=181527 RepID=A0ACD3A8W7_9AGAR|nr:hypothetical protein BDN72DRAFT_849875 [Pluteus cervinus]